LAIYVLVVYVGQVLIGTPDPAQGVLEWHRQAWDYQLGLTATHPWSSKWWSWPLMLRPVLFYYQNDDQGRILMITALGNPILWWASTLAAIVSLGEIIRLWFKDRGAILNHTLTPLLIGYLSFFLPWIPIHRVVFIYHYLPCYAFALLMLTYWLTKVWRCQPWLVTLFVAIVVGISFYYLPLAMGSPITQESLNHRLWFQSWL
jgi:dolichyl-phosphate-mannose--protein O-mannosyl transferase